MKTTPLYTSTVLLLVLLLCLSWQANGQIALNAPEPAPNPNFNEPGEGTPWPFICAGLDVNGDGQRFNQFFVEISWAGNPNADNEFILELSDAGGDFGNPVELATTNTQNNNNPFLLEFAIPTDTRGLAYRLRIRSTSPAFTSPESDPYNMYYMDFTSNLNISPNGDGSTPGSIQICDGASVNLAVDNIDASLINTYQYVWFRSGTPISSETGPSITVSTSGMYMAFIDYGPNCTGAGNTESNFIDVTAGTSSGIAIEPPSTSELCSGQTETLTSSVTDGSYSYQWFKDGVALAGATTISYAVDGSVAGFEGDYQIEVSGPGICIERSDAVTMSNAGAFSVDRDNPENLVLLPGQTQTLSVTTDANTPGYQWYRNNNPIIGATSDSYEVNETGVYYAEVTQTGGACASTTLISPNTTVVSPTSFEAIIDYTDSYTACVSTSVVLDIRTINAVLADNSTLDVTSQLASQFIYRWRRDGALLSGQTSRSISLTAPSQNGNYTLEGALLDNTFFSNALSVQLLTSEVLAITATGTTFCSGSEPITLSTATELSGETFQWQRDGATVDTSSNELSVSQAGTYRLVLERNGCSLNSNEIAIEPLNPDLITLDPSNELVFPEGTSRTVTASGGTAYRWLDANNVEIGTGASVNINTEGTYTLIANIDDCEITRTVSAEYLDTFKVPNVITPNADGFNDQWVLPNSYANRQDINVIIYDDNGIELMNEMGYQNNWPTSASSFPRQNMVFYYIIKNA
ncbi:MAG: gliding motility-associated C-terminal domain-containing protein, partial [Bacteroidota bacterium]